MFRKGNHSLNFKSSIRILSRRMLSFFCPGVEVQSMDGSVRKRKKVEKSFSNKSFEDFIPFLKKCMTLILFSILYLGVSQSSFCITTTIKLRGCSLAPSPPPFRCNDSTDRLCSGLSYSQAHPHPRLHPHCCTSGRNVNRHPLSPRITAPLRVLQGVVGVALPPPSDKRSRELFAPLHRYINTYTD